MARLNNRHITQTLQEILKMLAVLDKRLSRLEGPDKDVDEEIAKDFNESK